MALELLLLQDNLLFAKALSCSVSVVKANCVRDGTAHYKRVQREISVSVATNRPFWQINLLTFPFECKFWRNDTATPVVF